MQFGVDVVFMKAVCDVIIMVQFSGLLDKMHVISVVTLYH